MTGYAVECALKASILRYLGESAALFGDRAYVRKLAECWTHDLDRLVEIAGLDAEFGKARGGNAILDSFWTVVKEWDESSRYELFSEAQAKTLFEAVSQSPDGVFEWLRTRW